MSKNDRKKNAIKKLKGMVEKPKVTLIDYFKPVIAELGPRLAYGSIDRSKDMDFFNRLKEVGYDKAVEEYGDIEASDLLDRLVWVNQHNSVVEHIVMSYYIDGISRAVLQELVRHRIASYTVKSTRYTLGKIIYGCLIPYIRGDETAMSSGTYYLKKNSREFFVINERHPNFENMIDSLYLGIVNIFKDILDEDATLIFSKEQMEYIKNLNMESLEEIVDRLNNMTRVKNVGDYFKTVLPEMMRVELQFTINARSLKNFIELRDKGSAYWEMRELAREIINATPDEVLQYIVKEKRKEA